MYIHIYIYIYTYIHYITLHYITLHYIHTHIHIPTGNFSQLDFTIKKVLSWENHLAITREMFEPSHSWTMKYIL